MDGDIVFGLAAVAAMLLFYALEDRSPWYVLAQPKLFPLPQPA
jgi:hypothetical protein